MRQTSLPFVMTLAVATLLIVGCGSGAQNTSSTQNGGSGANHVQMETRQVSGFTALTFTGVGKINVQQTGQEKLTVTAPANLLPKVTTSVSQGRLTIGFEGTPSPANQNGIAYALQVKQLTDIEVMGTGYISAGGLKLQGNTLTATVSGSGTVKLVGNAQDQKVTVSGTGIYNGSSFATYTGTVNVSGGGSAVVNATTALNAQVSGSGSIEYIGNPTVAKTISGSGTITQR